MTLIESNTVNNNPVVVAQITDSHLFSSLDGLHYGHNVLNNLTQVLLSISDNPKIDFIVFTGDISQDHSAQSYQNFVDCVYECNVSIPIYYLAGNHDEFEMLDKHFSALPFQADKSINLCNWQVQLVDSKSETPAGYVSEKALVKLRCEVKDDKHQLLMMHHHPIDVGYFIDNHGLKNKDTFWRAIDGYENIKAIACGHVHGAIQLTRKSPQYSSNQSKKKDRAIPSAVDKEIILYTCPATSMQFDPNVDGVAALAKGPGYRIFHLHKDGKLVTEVVYP